VTRPARYYVVGELDLRKELERLCRLDALGGEEGPLASRPPELAIRRARRRPRNRLGFAVPAEWRLSVTAYPGAREGDLKETLLHELVHLHVGARPGSRRWHGREFKEALRRAMTEAYGVTGVRVANSYHGAYAEAIERKKTAVAGVHPGQLGLDIAA
jgi:hypothetical protein